MSNNNQQNGDAELKKGLKGRHLSMISVGGVIGAGFFMGAGSTINTAGPAVVFAYLVGGFITLLVMMLLTEMAVSNPVAGSFQVYARKGVSPYAGFLTGWTYWLAFLMGPASETIAAGTFLHLWFPQVPIWIFCLAVALLMTIINLIGVAVFGEVEFWLSMIKVVALLVFIVWGCLAMGFHMNSGVTVTNMVSNGGFAPAGILGLLGAMIIVMFSYGGTEAIGTAAEESINPEKDIPKALRGTVFRIVVLFVISIGVLVCVLPWQQAGISSSPFVEACRILGGSTAANIMNFVVLTAALSCIDSGVYATSRMLFSLSRDGYFPKVFSKVDEKHQTPVVAIFVSSLVLFVGAIVYLAFPDFAYVYLASVSGFGFLFSWLMIALSQPKMRRLTLEDDPAKLKWKCPGVKVIQPLVVVLMIGILVAQLFVPGGKITLLSGLIWLCFVSIYYFTIGKKMREKTLMQQGIDE